MRFNSLSDFAARGPGALGKGPVAIIIVEDPVEVASTLRHHLDRGFAQLVVFAPADITLPTDLMADALYVSYNTKTADAFVPAVNAVIQAARPGTWLYYCFNAEYLLHPFGETRSVGEMLVFHAEERRDAMLTYVVDLYAADLNAHPTAVSLGDAWLDKSGYYAQARGDAANNWAPMERQLDFFGGLRWRFEEHIPWKKRKIDRISLFRAARGLELRPDHTFNIAEYNTYACPWHNNLTAAICSFRTAKALKANPGSAPDIVAFKWRNSVAFTWRPQQLLDLGLMEPGQWF
ncbi:hypothetical protein [Oceaniglobus ichthyenteri]|uniref:hypothetical protein n=1 Tax=Oceaniglobus ichthyenteri TaxID=2136177 RepID=UPI000D3844E5|nr:hypothetical protein [Oceaniglobus ichthyenteri]